jgi:hypothetical protein
LGIELHDSLWHHSFLFFPLTMTDTRFCEIAEKFVTLSNELKNCTDPAERLDLLREFRHLLAKADRLIADESVGELLGVKMWLS